MKKLPLLLVALTAGLSAAAAQNRTKAESSNLMSPQ